MGLIIKDKIPMFMRGYPTVSDKYNVAGGILEGNLVAKFGDLVQFGTQPGYFKAIGAGQTIDAVTKLAGIVLATNVKLAQEWPGEGVQVNPGEAFNLMVNGFVAIELAATAVKNDVTANAKVYVTANGAFTTATDANALKTGGAATPIPGMVFTGMIENHGTADAPKYFAEILVGCAN